MLRQGFKAESFPKDASVGTLLRHGEFFQLSLSAMALAPLLNTPNTTLDLSPKHFLKQTGYMHAQDGIERV